MSDCGLRIADCGLFARRAGRGGLQPENSERICLVNPQSAIRNPQSEGGGPWR
jgi:hypothetical protein